MKILLVGGTSSVGHSIAEKMTRLGQVISAGRREAEVFFDLTHWDSIPVVDESYDVVIHVAADFAGPTAEDFIRAELTNVVGTLSVCRLAEHCGAKHLVIMSSISATYGPGDAYYGAYALSKRHAEEAALLFCAERTLPLTVLRPTQVYDAKGKCRRHQPLLYLMADKAQAGENILIHGSHDARRNYLYLDDLAEICSRIVEMRHTGVFDCAHPHSPKLSEVALAAFSAFANGGKIQFQPDKPHLVDLPTSVLTSCYEDIDFYPQVDIQQGFERIRQFRESVS